MLKVRPLRETLKLYLQVGKISLKIRKSQVKEQASAKYLLIISSRESILKSYVRILLVKRGNLSNLQNLMSSSPP